MDTVELTPLWHDHEIWALTANLTSIAWLDWVQIRKALFVKRDDYEHERARYLQRNAELRTEANTLLRERDEAERRYNETMGIGTPYLDGFTEQQLERYSQLSPPEMFRLLLNAEQQLAAATQRAEAQGEVWLPLDLDFRYGAATIAQIGDQMFVNLYGETLIVNLPENVRLCKLRVQATGQGGG